jgi:hypothetical protein
VRAKRILKRIGSPMHGEFTAPREYKRIKRIFITSEVAWHS